MGRLNIGSAVATILAVFASDANAAEFFLLPGTQTLYMMGEITEDDPSILQRFLDSHEIDTLGVAGPGGSMQSALIIGEMIKSKEIATLTIPDRDCASACGLIFLAGGVRVMGDGSRIGVHLPFINFDQKSGGASAYCSQFRDRSAQGVGLRPTDLLTSQLSPFSTSEACLTGTYQMAFEDAYTLLNLIDDSNVDQQVFRDMMATHPSNMTWYMPEDGSRLNISTSR